MKPTSPTAAAAERAVIAWVALPGDPVAPDDALDELRALAEAAGAQVVGRLVQQRRLPDRATYLGAGRVEELKAQCEALEAPLVVFGRDLSPSQGLHLEQRVGRRVIDRSQLIMDLFALRARTRQARLQVELAQLEYSLPRLKRLWTHLDRYKGGIGMRGPGETQLELDRREIENKISDRRRRLRELEQAATQRRAGRSDRFRVGLVGYTNAGKSTLFNRLTRSGELAEDRPFTTLDTKTASWRVAPGLVVLLSDTVGFVRELPHHLIASFHATLREALEADLLLHVVDGTRPDSHRLVESVEEVLRDVGAGDRPRLLVVNKIDGLADRAGCARFGAGSLLVSARSGEGIRELLEAVAQRARAGDVEVLLRFPHAAGAEIAAVRAQGDVRESRFDADAVWLRARLPRSLAGRLRRFETDAAGFARNGEPGGV